MKRTIPLLLFLLLICAALSGGAQAADESAWLFAVVNNPDPADRLNLRTRPDTGAISLGKFYNGTPVTIMAIEGEWAYVSLYKDFEGYMHTDYLAIGEEAEKVASAMPIVTVTFPAGKNVYDSMLANPSVSVPFHIGMQLEVMGVMEDWLFVRAGEIAGFTENSGTMPRVTFSTQDATPPARVSIVATPTPSPTPLPVSFDGRAYARVTAQTWLYEDEALTRTICVLFPGRALEIESSSSFVCRTTADGQTGYVDASYLTFGSELGPDNTPAPVEDTRRVTEEDWVIFASTKAPSYLYADKALTQPIRLMNPGSFIRVFNEMGEYITVIEDGRIAGYLSAGSVTVHITNWPFHVTEACAAVNNPIPSDRLHLRESPNKNARSLGRYYNGTIVTLLDNFSGRSEWTHVDICGVQGYMMSDYLTFSPDPDEVFPSLHLYEISNPNTGDLHLRSEPDTGSSSLGLYKNGTLTSVIGVCGDWAHVICDGQTGFMLHKHLKTAIGTTFDPY